MPDPGDLTVDHATPRSRGGKNWDDNLLPACAYCNNLKDNRTLSEWRKFVRVRVIQSLSPLGYFDGDLRKVKIIFYGEGNDSPFNY